MHKTKKTLVSINMSDTVIFIQAKEGIEKYTEPHVVYQSRNWKLKCFSSFAKQTQCVIKGYIFTKKLLHQNKPPKPQQLTGCLNLLLTGCLNLLFFRNKQVTAGNKQKQYMWRELKL